MEPRRVIAGGQAQKLFRRAGLPTAGFRPFFWPSFTEGLEGYIRKVAPVRNS
jgi:hypothetical protein